VNHYSNAVTVVGECTESDPSLLPTNFWAQWYNAKWISSTSPGTEDLYYDVVPGQDVVIETVFLGYCSVISILKSTAGAECVNAPIAIKSIGNEA